MNRIFLVSMIIFLTASMWGTVHAQDTGSSNDWSFELSPMYLWAISIDGDQTVKGKKADLDVGWDDVFDNLNGAFIVNFQGMYQQRWGFLTDLNYVVLEMEDGKIDVDFTETIFEIAGFYRFFRGIHAVDGLAGLRYTHMDVELDFPDPLPNVDQDQDWVDPFIGARWQWHFADKWRLNLRTDLGGFGVGSDFTWNAVGLIDFQPWQHVGLFGGYRALYQDYSDGSGSKKFEYDATTHGPILGFNFKW